MVCLCDAKGVGLAELARMFPEDSFSRRSIDVIKSSDYQDPGGDSSSLGGSHTADLQAGLRCGHSCRFPGLRCQLVREGG